MCLCVAFPYRNHDELILSNLTYIWKLLPTIFVQVCVSLKDTVFAKISLYISLFVFCLNGVVRTSSYIKHTENIIFLKIPLTNIWLCAHNNWYCQRGVVSIDT